MITDNGNRFWIPVSDWMIGDIISNEIISPPEFYPKRNFGINNLSFPDNLGIPIHSKNSITILTSPYLFSPTESKPVYLLVKGDALNEKFMEKIDDETFIYKSSIYLRKGNFQARFYSESDLNLFYVRSKMSLEAKTIEKYKIEGYFKENNQSILFFDPKLASKPLLRTIQIIDPPISKGYLFDKAFNHVKGFIYGLIIGYIKERGTSRPLESVVSALKSKINGFITRLEMSDSFEESHFIKINESIEKLSEIGEFDLMNSIQKRIIEIKKLQELHIQSLSVQKESLNNLDHELLNKLKNDLERLGSIKAEHDYSLKTLRDEKQKLFLKSKRLTRPKKDSPEYFEKAELKDRIEFCKEDIRKIMDKLKPINQRIREIRQELSPVMNYRKSEFLSTRDEIFYKISRDLNQKILDTKKRDDLEVKLENIDFIENITLDLKLINQMQQAPIKAPTKSIFKTISLTYFEFAKNPNEVTLFEYIISVIICFTQDSSSDVSINKRDEIIESLYNTLSIINFNQSIIDDLRRLKNFVTGLESEFNLPDSSIVLQNFYAFILKIQSNENLESFLLSSNIPNHAIARVFYSTFMGFANLPKTFTKPVFGQSQSIIDKLDDHLFNNYLKSNLYESL